MSLIHNEQTKLTAAAIDRLSTACIALGVIAPVVSFGMGGTGYSLLTVTAFGVVWFSIGACLHFLGRAILRRLRP